MAGRVAAFEELVVPAAGGMASSVALCPIPGLSLDGREFLVAEVRTPWPDGIRVVFPPGTAGVHVVVAGRARVPPRYYVAGTRGFRPLGPDNSATLGPADFVDADTAQARVAADPSPTPRWSSLVSAATFATGIVGGIGGGANPLVLREGDSPRVLEAALAQFKKALARPLPQPATSVYPGTDHLVAALRQRNPLGDFWVATNGRDIEVKTLLDACEVGPDLWRSFRPDPEKATPGDPLVAPYAELAAPWWERQLEKQRAEIRDILRATGEYTYDRHGRVHTVESRDQHGTPIVKKWHQGRRELVKLPRSTECFKQDKDGHPALDDLPGLQAELAGYASRASKTLKAPPGNWTARFAQLPCLVDPARPWSPARPLKYKWRLQLGILVAAVDRLAGLGEPMLAAIEIIAADHQDPDKLADRVAQLRIAAASYGTAKHEHKNPVQRCGPDCVKCCAQLVVGPDPVVDTADLGQQPRLIDVIKRGIEGSPTRPLPPPPPPAVPKPVAFAVRRPSLRAKRPIPRRSSSVSSLDKRPRLGSVGSGGPSPTAAGSQRSLSASSWLL